jgi:uracil-DNA glycosylase
MRHGKTRPSLVVERGPGSLTLGLLREEARSCTACDLYKRATQTVFGEGKPSARIVLVGEQPGNEEDLSGRPFVGPAGRLLDEAMAEADMDRREVYITNIVKHFKWKGEEGGKRRIHERPRQDEVEACRPWFDKELWIIKPEVLVCLGATAANAVMGRTVTIRSVRGRALVSPYGMPTFVTVHPSAILRMPDRAVRQVEMRRFVGDLRRARRALSDR